MLTDKSSQNAQLEQFSSLQNVFHTLYMLYSFESTHAF